MTAIGYEDWTRERARAARPQLSAWIAASVIAHLLVLLWLLLAPDLPPLTMSDRAVQDRPPVEVIALPPAPNATPLPDDAKPDRPVLHPPPRKLDATSDMPAMESVDPRALQQFLDRQALRDKEARGGHGSTWTTCSLLSPERRVLEPACDGMLIQRSDTPGVAASLAPPDAETLAAIRKYNPEPTGQDIHDALGDSDPNTDSSYRNQTDEVYGKMPWEK